MIYCGNCVTVLERCQKVLILIYGKPILKIPEEVGLHEEKTMSIRECLKPLELAKKKPPQSLRTGCIEDHIFETLQTCIIYLFPFI